MSKTQNKTGLIYDIGMHNGQDTAYFLHRGYKVVAIEADPNLVELGQKKFADFIKSERLEILNIGISNRSSNQEFWICDENSVWNSFNKKFSSRDGLRHHPILIPCTTLDKIIEKYGMPYYLKIDIEGNDKYCLESLKNFEVKPKYISVEVDENFPELMDLLSILGYSKFKCISQFNYYPLQLPKSMRQIFLEGIIEISLSRVFVSLLNRIIGIKKAKVIRKKIAAFPHFYKGWCFPEGASGPFGKEAPGRWYSLVEMRQVYTKFQVMKDLGKTSKFWNEKSYSFWIDIHASRD